MTVDFLLLLLGAICFFIQFLLGTVVHPPAEPSPAYTTFSRVHWLALGLLFWILVPLIAAGAHLH